MGSPRTGSSHLVSLLDSHPDVACWDDEIFNEGEVFDQSPYSDPRDFLRERVFNVSAQVVGFKLLWDAFNYVPACWAWIRELDIDLVHTCRSNFLDSYISFKLASINNAFTCWYGDYRTQRFEANYEECLDWFETVEACDAEMRNGAVQERIKRIEIEYHELCEGQDRVLLFLGVASHPLRSELKKQRDGRQIDIISNYEDLKKGFADSNWARFFVD